MKPCVMRSTHLSRPTKLGGPGATRRTAARLCDVAGESQSAAESPPRRESPTS